MLNGNNHRNNRVLKGIIIGMAALFAIIGIIAAVQGGIQWIINEEVKLVVREDETFVAENLTVNGTLRGLSPIKIEDTIDFVNDTGQTHFRIYHAGEVFFPNHPPDAFNDSLIFDTVDIDNPYFMEVCFWDSEIQNMTMCLNQGAPLRATTFRRSVQIVGNSSLKENDENFTLCEGANYVDCGTDLTGADLLVQDDIEAQSIYANEDLKVDGDANITGNLEVSGIMSVTLSLGCAHANISSGNITYSAFYMSVLGEGGSNDDLDNIEGGSEGDVINIFPTDSGSDIKLKHGTGNLDLDGADCDLKSLGTKAELRKKDSIWKLIVCLN